jgi:hypothetical protein
VLSLQGFTAMRILLAALLSAVAIFFWGFVFWGPVLNMTVRLMAPLPATVELDALAPLRAEQLADGMYVYPGPLLDQTDDAAVAAWEKKVNEGPIVHMTYKSSGISPMDPNMFAKGFAHNFLLALLGGVLLSSVAEYLPSYGRRFALLALVSLIAALWTPIGDMIWWFHPTKYALGSATYTLVAGLLMAAITAAIIQPAGTLKPSAR